LLASRYAIHTEAGEEKKAANGPQHFPGLLICNCGEINTNKTTNFRKDIHETQGIVQLIDSTKKSLALSGLSWVLESRSFLKFLVALTFLAHVFFFCDFLRQRNRENGK